jgi:glutamine amidotransferase
MIALVDYGMGNIKSVENALLCAGADVRITAAAADILRAEAIIIPGVGAFAEGMLNVQRLGIMDALNEAVLARQMPFLGICLGMQFLADLSHEGGETGGFGWIPGTVERLAPEDRKRFKVPHMGWNDVERVRPCSLFEGIEKPVFYFVHSYHFRAWPEYVTGVCRHGQDVVVAVQRENIFGVQFHPEKSQGMGLRLLKNFCRLAKVSHA